MPNYRRNRVPSGAYFLTFCTYARRNILTTDLGRDCLRESFEEVRDSMAFTLVAMVLLPDHIHLILILPSGDDNFSTRIKRIKHGFSRRWLDGGGTEATVTAAQKRKGLRGVWQPRFWEHTVRDDEDMERCVDYIHWNPRKHELATRIADWPYSTFHQFVKRGQYENHWGGEAPESLQGMDLKWGEFNNEA